MAFTFVLNRAVTNAITTPTADVSPFPSISHLIPFLSKPLRRSLKSRPYTGRCLWAGVRYGKCIRQVSAGNDRPWRMATANGQVGDRGIGGWRVQQLGDDKFSQAYGTRVNCAAGEIGGRDVRREDRPVYPYSILR